MADSVKPTWHDLPGQADLALKDLLDNGGRLTPEQERFYYATMEDMMIEQYEQSINHHLASAKRHAGARRWKYAQGSMRKAKRWMDRLEKLIAMEARRPTGPMDAIVDAIAEQTAKDVEEMVLHGSGNPREPGGILNNKASKISFGTRILRRATGCK